MALPLSEISAVWYSLLSDISAIQLSHFPEVLSVGLLHMLRTCDPDAGADACDPAEELGADRHQHGHAEGV